MFISVRPAPEAGTLIGAVKHQCAENDRMPDAEREWRLDTWKEGDAIVLVLEPKDSYWKVHRVLNAVMQAATELERRKP